LPLETLSAMVGRILPVFSLLVPFWLIWVMCGFRPMREVWPACLTAGASFGIAQGLISNLHGPWLAGIGSSLISMLAMVVLLKLWQPKSIWSFEHETAVERAAEAAARPAVGAGVPLGHARSQRVPQRRRQGPSQFLEWRRGGELHRSCAR
jgi:lactate permease